MVTMTSDLTTLTMSTEAIDHLMIAAQRSRSIAAEGGYLDVMTGIPGIVPGTDRWLGDERTITMLERITTGQHALDKGLWINLAHMVNSSVNWQLSLSLRGVRMPTTAEIITEAYPDVAERVAAAAPDSRAQVVTRLDDLI